VAGLAFPALAIDARESQVQIEARIVEVHAEFLAGMGVNFDDVTAGYSSTGAQEPFRGGSTQTNGTVSVGGRLFVTTGLGETQPRGPFGIGPVSVGAGVFYNHLFGGANDIFGISRHHGGNGTADVFASREIKSFTDVVAAAKIPVVLWRPRIVTADGGQATIVLVPEIGATFIDTETSLRSDQTFFGGNDSTASRSETKTGLVAGLGVETELGKIPMLGDIPVLAGLFYRARHVPGSEVSQQSPFGFTETVRTESTWEHQALIVFVVPFIIRDRGE
jgi:type II secretory pathway component GspD/PulD (secretin)